MELKSFTVNLPRILLCTTALLALGACSSGSSSGEGESALPDTTAPNDSTGGPDTPPAGTPGTTSTDTPTPPNDTPAPPSDTPATPPTGTTTSEVSGNAQFVGIIDFSQNSGQFATAEISAGFIRFNRSFPTTGLTDELLGADESCSVETIDLSGADDIDEIPGFEDVGYELVSAGQVITVLSPAGSYVDLIENTEFGFNFYEPSVEDLPTPFPADLIINIPGKVFPKFENVAVPNVEPLVLTNGSGTDGNYSWTAGNNPDARISIDLTGIDPSNPGSTSLVTVSCIAKDDGQFSMPASVTNQLPTGSSTFATIERIALKLVQSGNAILMISNSSGQ
ncbi:MAG: hypothetical protein V3U76_14600 [Granulosicoccus sp.]